MAKVSPAALVHSAVVKRESASLLGKTIHMCIHCTCRNSLPFEPTFRTALERVITCSRGLVREGKESERASAEETKRRGEKKKILKA